MSTRMEVLLWAQRICAKRSAPPHQMLEIGADSSLEAAQEAFHNIARLAHPDLYRTTCTSEELELVTSAFSLVAAAYQQIRSQRTVTTRMPTLRADEIQPPRAKRPSAGGVVLPGGVVVGARSARRPTEPPPNRPAAARPTDGVLVPEAAPSPAMAPAQQMSSRALIHYRKAEQSLRRGDVPQGTLHLKMAIAADPTSTFLRAALREIQAEVTKKP